MFTTGLAATAWQLAWLGDSYWILIFGHVWCIGSCLDMFCKTLYVSFHPCSCLSELCKAKWAKCANGAALLSSGQLKILGNPINIHQVSSQGPLISLITWAKLSKVKMCVREWRHDTWALKSALLRITGSLWACRASCTRLHQTAWWCNMIQRDLFYARIQSLDLTVFEFINPFPSSPVWSSTSQSATRHAARCGKMRQDAARCGKLQDS